MKKNVSDAEKHVIPQTNVSTRMLHVGIVIKLGTWQENVVSKSRTKFGKQEKIRREREKYNTRGSHKKSIRLEVMRIARKKVKAMMNSHGMCIE